MSIRVVMIGPFGLRPKSTMSKRALPLAKALAVRGHRMTLLLPPWSWPEDSGKTWVEEGVTVENIALPPRLPLLWHALIAARLVRRALALQPDVVHCFKPKAYAGLAAWALWWLQKLGVRARLVVDSDDWEGFGGWNDLEAYSLPQKWVFAWQERWGLHHHDALTVASKTLQSIAWSLGVPPRKVWYVPNGVHRSQIVPREQSPSRGPPTILLYTRFFEFTLERVVDVFAGVRAARPATRFLVVGEGLFGEEDRFLALCRRRGLGDAVEYAGWEGVEALPDHLARAQVALYPFDDTLINRTKCAAKLLELLSAGVPVVAEAVGQNAQAIRHGESGMLVPPGDVAAMVEAVLCILGDPGLQERLGKGAQQYLAQSLTWEHLSAQVEAVYRQVLA